MKKYIALLGWLLMAEGYGKALHAQGAYISIKADSLPIEFQPLSQGVFLRSMLQFDPNDTLRNDDKFLKPITANTYYFFRFDQFFRATAQQDVYFAKIFISERYYEKDFFSTYRTTESLKRENRGFYVMAKVGTEGFEPKLWIYPSLITNVCLRKMHANGRKCRNGEEHLEALLKIASLSNTESIDSLFPYEYKTFSIARTMLRFSTAKYAYSDDHLTNSSYELNLYPYKDILVAGGIDYLIQQQIEYANQVGPADSPVSPNSYLNLLEADSGRYSSKKYLSDSPVRPNPDQPSVVSTHSKTSLWMYAGMLKADSTTWMTSFIKSIANKIVTKGDTVMALYPLRGRSNYPVNEKGEWRKEEVMSVIPQNKRMRVLQTRFLMPNSGNSQRWLWLEIEIID